MASEVETAEVPPLITEHVAMPNLHEEFNIDEIHAHRPCASSPDCTVKKEFIIHSLLLLMMCLAAVVTIYSVFTKLEDSAATTVQRTVSTDCGLVLGTMDADVPVFVFKGIPYAKPPVGNLRWKLPIGLKQAGECWNGTFLATSFGNSCAQYQSIVEGSEDCLYLNVLTPARKHTQPLPVLVWIHGGYLTEGSGSETGAGGLPGYFPNSVFVNDLNVVAVTFNYRLNAFGFMALDVLSQAAPTKTSGNYGFMDQILALQWVQRNIAAFGGDKSKVTILGQSSGGTSVFALLAADSAQGLFHAAISMSGSPVFNKTSAEASKDNLVFVKKSKCDRGNSSETLECLYQLSTEQVLRAVPWNEYPYWAMEDLMEIPSPGHFDGALAVVDGDVVKYPPKNLAEHQSGLTAKVTVVIGNTAQEIDIMPANKFGPDDYERYVTLVSSKLRKFMNASDVQKGVSLYDPLRVPAGSRPQYLYETLVSDLRVVCATDVFARNLAKSSRHDVYRYIVSATPSHLFQYFGSEHRFAFHAWDSLALFGYKLKNIFSPKPSDLSLTKLLQSQFKGIMENGCPFSEAWTAFPNNTYLIGNEGPLSLGKRGYHSEQCSFWMDRGFFAYSWIN